MKSSLHAQSRLFLKFGGIALLLVASWQLIWLYQSTQVWQELSSIALTTGTAALLGLLYSQYQRSSPTWLLRIFTVVSLIIYLISIHQTQDIRLMVGLMISLFLLLVLVVD